MPSLVAVAVNVTTVPAHTLFVAVAMLTVAGDEVLTLNTNVAALSHPAALVKPVLV